MTGHISAAAPGLRFQEDRTHRPQQWMTEKRGGSNGKGRNWRKHFGLFAELKFRCDCKEENSRNRRIETEEKYCSNKLLLEILFSLS
jgi:hypothetical protein